MGGRHKLFVLAVILTSTPASAWADDLTSTDKFLCTATQATRCSMEEDCWSGPAWEWNIPQFIEIDFKKKQVSTTEASGEHRATPIKNLARENAVTHLQGIEGGRAFSFVIDELTGSMSVAVATKDGTTSVLGSCTPR